MTVYSPAQIYEAMMRHGAGAIPVEKRIIWVAIALAESSGNDQAVGPVGERGIWQIYLKAHPDVTAAQAVDIETGTEAARKISNNWTNMQPWTTYTHGSYKNKMNEAVLGVQKADPNFFTTAGTGTQQIGSLAGTAASAIGNATGITDAAGNIVGAVSDVGSVIGGFFHLITNVEFWKRAGIFVLGFFLVIVSIFLLTDVDVKDLAR